MNEAELTEPAEKAADSPASPRPQPRPALPAFRPDRIAAALALVLLLFFASRALVTGLVRSSAELAVRSASGVPADIRGVKLDLLKGKIRLRGITLYNPPGFEAKKLAYLPSIEIDIHFWAFLRARVHLKRVRIDIENVWVERNGEGSINLQKLASGPKKKPAPSKKKGPPPVRVDHAEFSLDQIIYTESARKPPFIRNFRVRMNSSLENAADPYDVTRQIAEAVLERALKSAVTIQAGKMADRVTQNVRGFFQSRLSGR